MEPTLRFLPLQPGPPLQGALRKAVLTPELLRAPGLVGSYMTVSHLNWAPKRLSQPDGHRVGDPWRGQARRCDHDAGHGDGRGAGTNKETQCSSLHARAGGEPLPTSTALAQPQGWGAAPPTDGGASASSPAAAQSSPGVTGAFHQPV